MPSEQDIASILHTLLGKRRLASLADENGDIDSALLAFQWEMDARRTLLAPAGIAEIALRNAIDQEISNWWHNNSFPGTWTDKNIPPEATILKPFVHPTGWEKRASKNLSSKNRPVNHCDLIAHTSFGTWKNMIGNPIAINKNPPTEKKKLDSWNAAKQRDKECALLWKNILFSAFPNIPGRAQRGKISPRAYIGARVSRIAALRNRMFHWDNLTALDIKMRYRDINEVLSAINPLLGTWLDSSYESEINQLIDDKPSWLKPYLSKK